MIAWVLLLSLLLLFAPARRLAALLLALAVTWAAWRCAECRRAWAGWRYRRRAAQVGRMEAAALAGVPEHERAAALSRARAEALGK